MATKRPTNEPSPNAYGEEALIEKARVRVTKRQNAGEWVGAWVTALGFMAAAGVCALALPWPRELDPWLTVVLVAAYALASRVRFYVGANYTVPTQLVLVPMLFLAPTPLVPALVALAQLVGVLPDLRTRKIPRSGRCPRWATPGTPSRRSSFSHWPMRPHLKRTCGPSISSPWPPNLRSTWR